MLLLACSNGDIRLAGGATNNTGRIEVCNNNLWGTVCDDLFGVPDATVACRQLGFNSTGATRGFKLVIIMLLSFFLTFYVGARVLPASQVADGVGVAIFLDNLQCRGTERRLFDCPRNAIGVHNCNHGEDVGVTCLQFVPGANQLF